MAQMSVQTDHQIVDFPIAHMMGLLDNASPGQPIVVATRGPGTTWVIHADGIDDVIANTRAEAITAMIDHALTILPGTGYSTLVPHGLRELP